MVENVPSYDLLIDRSRALDLDASVRFACEILERPEEELRAALETARNQPAFKPALVAADLTLAQVGRFEAKSLEHPEFEIDVRHLRLYRHGPRTTHVLGYLGEVSQEEIDALRRRGLRVGRPDRQEGGREDLRPPPARRRRRAGGGGRQPRPGARGVPARARRARPAPDPLARPRAAAGGGAPDGGQGRRRGRHGPAHRRDPRPLLRARRTTPTCSPAASPRSSGRRSSTRPTTRSRTAPPRTPTRRARCSRR